jgi:hypothetical protein
LTANLNQPCRSKFLIRAGSAEIYFSMPPRVVSVYDAPVPTVDDIMFGDPATRPPFPNEAWAGKMEPHEIALFCVNFKSDTPVREETGRPAPQSEATCRVFSSVEEAESYARGVVRAHPSTVCILRSKDEREVKRVSNGPFTRKVALVSLIGMAVWMLFAGGIGLTIIFLVRGLFRGPGFQWILALPAWRWITLVAIAIVLGFSALLLELYFRVRRKVAKFHQAINISLSPEERAQYREADVLAASPDPEDREKARRLLKEYSERIGQIRRDMK